MEKNKVDATEEKKGVFTKIKEDLKTKKASNEETTDKSKTKSTLKKVGVGVAFVVVGRLCALGIKSKMDKDDDDVDYDDCQETEDAESEDVESD